jgi:hypothetical protein
MGLAQFHTAVKKPAIFSKNGGTFSLTHWIPFWISPASHFTPSTIAWRMAAASKDETSAASGWEMLWSDAATSAATPLSFPARPWRKPTAPLSAPIALW